MRGATVKIEKKKTLYKCRVVSTVNEYQGCLVIEEHRGLIVLAFK